MIEVLATVILMGVGFTTLLSGIFSVVKISDSNQQRTRASIAVQAWAEQLQQPATALPATLPSGAIPQDYTTYIPCAGPGAYATPSASTGDLPSGYTATITQVRYLKSKTFSGGSPDFTLTQAQCYALPQYGNPAAQVPKASRPADNGMQEITLKVDSGPRADRVVDTLVIIKRDERCPESFDNADLGPC